MVVWLETRIFILFQDSACLSCMFSLWLFDNVNVELTRSWLCINFFPDRGGKGKEKESKRRAKGEQKQSKRRAKGKQADATREYRRTRGYVL